MLENLIFDYIIIGSGIAGLSVAKELGKDYKIALISKGSFRETSTYYAQGGIAVALSEDDNPNIHFQDTIKAGDGLCDPEMVNILVKEGPDRIKDLINIGMQFDKNNNGFNFGKEGAHSKRRILHSKDETGKEIEVLLIKHLQKNYPNIIFLENVFVNDLIVNNNEAYGCSAIYKDNLLMFWAQKAVIFASGGCGQIFNHNTNPFLSTGDGIAIAYKNGAIIQNFEFIQFHPTAFYHSDLHSDSIFLITEAVRGEGAVLRNKNGERFMNNYHHLKEMAPRDIVSRSIITEMQKTKATHVFLDLSNVKANIPNRFPQIYQRCLQFNLDITKEFIPIAPAAHYLMGGIKTNEFGQTNINRLYAVGEVADLGLHGANRLASNSLLDGIVFGYRVALNSKNLKPLSLPNKNVIFPLKNTNINSDDRAKILLLKKEIRDNMWHNVGIIRDKKKLEKSSRFILKQKYVLDLKTFDPSIIEIQNMLINAFLMTSFALKREESRGAHYRLDFPNQDDLNWKKNQYFSKNELDINNL